MATITTTHPDTPLPPVPWLKSNADKVMLLGLYLILLAYALHVVHDPSDKDLVPRVWEAAGMVLGALLTMITVAVKGAVSGGGSTASTVTAPTSPLDMEALIKQIVAETMKHHGTMTVSADATTASPAPGIPEPFILSEGLRAQKRSTTNERFRASARIDE